MGGGRSDEKYNRAPINPFSAFPRKVKIVSKNLGLGFPLGKSNSLRSEDPKIEIRCTHGRTNWDHNNAKAIRAPNMGEYLTSITSRCSKTQELPGAASPPRPLP